MTETPASSPERSRRTRRRGGGLRRLGLALLAVVLILALLAAALYLNRRAAAREVLVGWLERQGIQSEVEVERIELDGFVGRIRIGDPNNPDLMVERVEVDYAVALPWSKTGMGVSPSRIRLVRPVMRASWKNGKLSLGALDPLVEQFTGGPPRPDSRGPLVIVEGGRGRLDTEYGPVSILADARVDDGKLMRLSARMPAATLKSGEIEAQGLGATVDLTTTGDRIALRIEAGADRFNGGGVSGEAVRLSVDGDLPYPDMKTRRGDGRAVIDARLVGGVLGLGQTRMRDAEVAVRFDGATAGWIETLRLDGATDLGVKAAAIEGAGLKAGRVEGSATGGRLTVARDEAVRWSLETPLVLAAESGEAGLARTQGLSIQSNGLSMGGRDASFEATGPVQASFERIGFGDLELKQARGDLSLDIVKDDAVRIAAEGALRSAGGAWPLFGPVGSDDIAELAEMKTALGDFALAAPSVRFVTGSAGTEVRLARPVTLSPANGGVLTVAEAGEAAYQAEPGRLGGGALNLTATRGRGLPEMAVAVSKWRLTETGFEALLDGRARLDFDLARGIDARTRGLLVLADGRLTYTTPECVDLTVERLELDENDVHQVAGKLCPETGPLLRSKDGIWRVAGGFQGVSAQAPFLGMRFEQASGRVVVDGTKAGVGLTATVAEAQVVDATTPKRFETLAASGQAALANEGWSGGFDLKGTGEAAAATLGRLTLAHDGRTGAGGIHIAAPEVRFVEGGLQPSMLSPMVEAFVQSPVTGAIGFDGRFDWTKEAEPTSSGLLSVPGLDFVSPAGPVKGARGEIQFTSLSPAVVTAPNQRLTIDSLDVGADATALDLTFAIDGAGISFAGGSVQAGGGTVSVEPFVMPLDPTQAYSGVVVLDRVQLGDLVADSGFADKVLLDALVSGRLPFIMDPKEGLKITAGSLGAVQPGRLSIKREVLTDVDAGGGGEGVPPNMVEDLAYQAMENLAFDMLSADVNSLDGGRVSVLFHIRGRHEPPQRQELRLTLAELISREFLNRELPLPSGTQIDLTLDTTLNANQLFADIMAVNRARQGRQDDETPAPLSTP
ncbi:intermembrane phospholipid transport protein YdbH family protein [Brevundimonas sp. SL130]|uniref:intermembrane phospholipid transport protein YdbH family protein n=1 Tax=Brevundimonas sp. SL130 TaxID=2995143 RepID=UPI00226CF0EA|nr:YdbH domain-containing protein [Brevundimonas sp. SL130]WAC60438.1 YdbH domain-containing protein [Brevundimonas sp. SL130]